MEMSIGVHDNKLRNVELDYGWKIHGLNCCSKSKYVHVEKRLEMLHSLF